MTDSPPERNDDLDELDLEMAVDDVSEFSLAGRQLTALVSDHAVCPLDSDGRVAAWNDGARRLTGYDEDDVVGTHYEVFFTAAQREAGLPAELLERARADGRTEDEGWRLRRDGSRIWAREVIVSVREADVEESSESDHGGDSPGASDGRGDIVGYVRLLQDRSAERELREERAFTESVFEAQPDIVYAFDADRNYRKWNDRVPEVTGYTESELREMDPLEFVAPEHRDRIADAITRILEGSEHVDVEADLLTKDGRRIPYEFNSAPITDDSGTVLGFAGIGRDVTERKDRERELREERALTESIFAAQPDLLYAYDTEGNLIHWNDRLERVSGYDADELEGMSPLDFIAPPDRDRIDEAIERILEHRERVAAEARVMQKDGEYVPYEFNSAPITDDSGTVLGFTGIGRDVSDRKARERELERLERLNATIRTVDETMVTAETRDEIESAIVEAFAAADDTRFAVIGRVDTTDAGRLSWDARAWAGIDTAGAKSVLSSYLDPPGDVGESVLETGTVHCYHDLRGSDVDDWRTDARRRDYGSIAVVPIAASGRTYGLLVVSGVEPTAFGDREREVLQEFGATVGHAINAMAVRRLLYHDTVVELEFESTDRGEVCIDLSARLDCWLRLDHVLPLTDEQFVYYVTARDVDPTRLESIAADHPGVTECRLIDATATDSHWELVVDGPTVAGLLADYGARMRSNVADRGVGNGVVQVSPDADVRDLVETITAAYPETELVSKRTVERPVETAGDFRRRVRAELTDKQRAALEAAYYGGYFEWPTRDSDASEIADRLGIARQTFHQHLRVAQAKLLTAYFEAGTEDGAEAGD